ncbi:MAG TPA: DNA polymerase III subunit alpha [Chryseosolibacter sp.]
MAKGLGDIDNSGLFLNCHTGFSFKYGTMSVRELFEEAKRCNVRKLVLTEINNTASYMEMLRLCAKSRPVEQGFTKYGEPSYLLEVAVGIEFRKDNQLLFIAIAKNNAGFEKINRFLSYHNRENKPLPARAPDFENDVFVIYPYGAAEPYNLRHWEFIGVRRSQLQSFAFNSDYRDWMTKFVVHHPVTFLPEKKLPDGKIDKRDFNTHRLLRAIAKNTLLSKLDKQEEAHDDEFMIREGELEESFAAMPELIANTRALVAECSINIPQGTDKNKKCYTNSIDLDLAYLKAETWKGYLRVYGDKDETAWQRIEKELAVIARKEFTSYYLIAYDLISFAKSKGYDFVGRGSGANSIVAYCLGITNVDPLELNLYFERFLNEERTSPPDFDIDFSWDNRDAIYEYIFQRYGYDHVCLLATHVTYQWRSILRELGKVFGLPKEEIDQLVENPPAMKERDHIASLVFRYASYIVGKELPANFSIHAGGVLITENPIYSYTATDLPPKGYPVSHFEMHNAEDFGIFKFDILSQRGLGHIKETAKLVKRNKGISVDVHQFKKFKEDEKVKELLRSSRAMGCFYVESPAMRGLLAKLKCEDYLTLVAASSIIRPGVASSGMMRAYIERFHAVQNGGSYEAIHPKMDELMKETYGVMVYQEDVIKVAHEFAGLSLTEADVLRRGMSGKYRSREEFQRVKDRFFEECQKRQYPQHVIDRVWFEIESFSGYSFAKGHSASYAVESYQSLYLKAHYPLEFMVGVINNFGGFYKTEFYFHEARMSGGKIQPPCVNKSEHLTTLYGDEIFVGFIHLKSLESRIAERIPEERTSRGEFKSLEDLLKRIPMGLEQARMLIRMGALRFTGKSKQRLLWEAMLFFSNARVKEQSSRLFETEPKEYPLPALMRNESEDAFDELELLGFSLSDPFRLLASTDRGDTVASELLAKLGRTVKIIGYVVTTKDTWTKNKDVMHFGTFLDKNGEVFDSVHFPDIARKFPFRGRGFYMLSGKVVEDFGVPAVEVISMEKLPMIHKRAEEFMRQPVEHREGSKVANSIV